MIKAPHYKIDRRRLAIARRLRRMLTDEEALLWVELRHLRAAGLAFRKQAGVGPFVADFLCRKAMLIVEVDGRHHDMPEEIEKDARRTVWLERHGYKVIRYAAHEIRSDLDGVVNGIEHIARGRFQDWKSRDRD